MKFFKMVMILFIAGIILMSNTTILAVDNDQTFHEEEYSILSINETKSGTLKVNDISSYLQFNFNNSGTFSTHETLIVTIMDNSKNQKLIINVIDTSTGASIYRQDYLGTGKVEITLDSTVKDYKLYIRNGGNKDTFVKANAKFK